MTFIGKTVPTKAVAYFLMDSSIPVELRYAALHEETYQRYMKLLLGKNKGKDSELFRVLIIFRCSSWEKHSATTHRQPIILPRISSRYFEGTLWYPGKRCHQEL